MAKFIKTNGEIIDVEPKNGTDFKLDELKSFVNGYIEIVYLSRKQIMVANEEGLLENLPVNYIASNMAGQLIVGDVLVCQKSEVK